MEILEMFRWLTACYDLEANPVGEGLRMHAIKKILVPFDGSAHANEAAAYAADLARRYDAALTLLYVDHSVSYAMPEAYPFSRTKLLADIQANYERDVGARHTVLAAGAPRVDSITQRGIPAAEILRCANDDGYDLIVMGTHGRTGVTRMFLGSVAEDVLRSAPCPVLTIRARLANTNA
jgi:nucleotide-binding universal stress UspA family protein